MNKTAVVQSDRNDIDNEESCSTSLTMSEQSSSSARTGRKRSLQQHQQRQKRVTTSTSISSKNIKMKQEDTQEYVITLNHGYVKDINDGRHSFYKNNDVAAASFNSLPDDVLIQILEFEGKKSYVLLGLLNKRCKQLFETYKIPKISYIYGYAPLSVIFNYFPRRSITKQEGISKGIILYNRRDIFEWVFMEERSVILYQVCTDAIKCSRLDILEEVFARTSNETQKRFKNFSSLCDYAVDCGKLACLKWLRKNKCKWSEYSWISANCQGHDHIIQYLRDNRYPLEWQICSDWRS